MEVKTSENNNNASCPRLHSHFDFRIGVLLYVPTQLTCLLYIYFEYVICIKVDLYMNV